MKELSIEEKAARYDAAIERAKAYHNANTKDIMEDIFPELKESEDERIRKEIIKLVKFYYGSTLALKHTVSEDEMVAWLEKQGESIKIKKGKNYLCTKTHKYAGVEWREGIKYYSPEDYSLVNQGCTCYCPKYSKEEHNNFFKEIEYDDCLENQAEQKPTDKVELEFNVGDWITFYGGEPFKILKVEAEVNGILDYLLLNQNGHDSFYNKKYVDENARLWTIEDAKDGDVLSYRDGQWIFIYKERIDDDSFRYHTLYSTIHQDLTINDAGFTLLGKAIKPATKEQHDLLFSKMKEAGYEWDAEKKELRKIEQKPTEDVDLPEFESHLCLMFQKFRTKGIRTNGEIINYVKEHSQKLKDILVKPAWSEEDEKMFELALNMIEWYSGKNEDKSKSVSDYLKSLKERIINGN